MCSSQVTRLPFCPMNLSVDFRYRMLVLLSLGLLGLFLVCLRTLEKATLRCCSTVFRWKYLKKMYTVHSLRHLANVCSDTGWHQHIFMFCRNTKCVANGYFFILSKQRIHIFTHLVLKNISVVSSVEGEWAPSCLHSHSISSVTWLGIMYPGRGGEENIKTWHFTKVGKTKMITNMTNV